MVGRPDRPWVDSDVTYLFRLTERMEKRRIMTQDPTATSLYLPSVYGAPTDSPLMHWVDVEEKLMDAPHYWLVTVGTNGVPIPRPIDGVWVRNLLYFGGHPNTRWRRNLASNSQAAINLETANHPIILEGTVSVSPLDQAVAEEVVNKSNEKYGFGQTADQYLQEACVFHPQTVIAWVGIFQNATKFLFEQESARI